MNLKLKNIIFSYVSNQHRYNCLKSKLDTRFRKHHYSFILQLKFKRFSRKVNMRPSKFHILSRSIKPSIYNL